MTTYLITGGAGFIGSNFVHHLHRRYPSARILVLDLLTYAGSVDNLPQPSGASKSRIEFWYGDVRNESLVDSLAAQADVVVHFAAETHVTRSIYDNRHFFETDVLGTQAVANAVLKYQKSIDRFVHISSSEVYGTACGPAMDEEHPLLPMSPYASAKAGADRLVYSYWATYGLPAVIVRPFNNYGPRQHLEKAVPRFITSCFLNEPLRVHGDGSAMRDWVYVSDTCEAIDRIAHCDRELVSGEVINIGTGRSTPIGELAQLIVNATGKSESLISCIGDRPGQVIRHTADISKAERLLKWRPAVCLDEGLAHTVAWYMDHREWWEKQLWMREIPIVATNGRRELH